MTDGVTDEQTTKRRFVLDRRLAKRLLVSIIFVAVIFGIGRTIRNSSSTFQQQQRELTTEIEKATAQLALLRTDEAQTEEIRRAEHVLNDLLGQRFHWSSIRYPWLLVASVLYAVGMMPSWWFWHRTLRNLGQQPTRFTSFRAFFIGHLGKYVPGKALVVVLRSTLVAGPKVSLGAGVAAVFVETLTLMAVGATLGGILLISVSGDKWLAAGAVGLALAAGIPTIPPLFRSIVDRIQRKKSDHRSIHLDGITWRLMGMGWVLLTIEWVVFGGSLAATLLAIPRVTPQEVFQWQTMCLITATVSLAIVLGFVSLVPGGAGIREWVVTTALGSVVAIGPIRALLAAILLRFVWLLPEVLIAGFVWRAGALKPERFDENKSA
ncbi:MAG: lysylphosphatidylglycerol synthase transmembrane domain-containing protein [Pirellulaceae bacterium]